ncbi:uncharacterized protein LOC122063439, partial [Macadamia integrifolia]|uniref:uncharacterized protein LOC122063439 n=1 Tax=Macadamia integrifolia TaxID=60698 RepID=UPI001C4F2DA4
HELVLHYQNQLHILSLILGCFLVCVCVEKPKPKPKIADKSQAQNLSYQAGEAKANAQMNKDQMMDKATNAMNSAKESCQETGQQMKSKAEGATDAVKNAMGMNK